MTFVQLKSNIREFTGNVLSILYVWKPKSSLLQKAIKFRIEVKLSDQQTVCFEF